MWNIWKLLAVGDRLIDCISWSNGRTNKRLPVSKLRECFSLFVYRNSPRVIFINQHFVEMDIFAQCSSAESIGYEKFGCLIHSHIRLAQLSHQTDTKNLSIKCHFTAARSVIRVFRLQVIFAIILHSSFSRTVRGVFVWIAREMIRTLKTATHICFNVHNLNKLQNG